jgi:hypothetical protein
MKNIFVTIGFVFLSLAAICQNMIIGSTNLINGDLTNNRIGIGTMTPSEKFEIFNGNLLLSNNGIASELRFSTPAAPLYTAFKAQNQLGSITYTLPAADGSSGQVLSTNGTGILSWNSITGAGTITAVGSMTSGDVFANTSANNHWLGLGSTNGRIRFNDNTIDYVSIFDASVIIGNSYTYAPCYKLSVWSDDNNADPNNYGNNIVGIMGACVSQGYINQTIAIQGEARYGYNTSIGVKGSSVGTSATLQSIGVLALSSTNTCDDLGVYAEGEEEGIRAYGTTWAGRFFGPAWCSAGVWAPSDIKLKENITDISDALDLIKMINPREFTYKNTPENKFLNLPKGNNYGFIAQELETVIPDLVIDMNLPPRYKDGKFVPDNTSLKAVNYIELIPILTQAIKEQQVIINKQALEIDKIKDVISIINNQLGSKDLLNSANLSTALNNTQEKQTVLYQNNPNPFSIETSIEFNIAEKFSTASLCIYNLQGTQLKKYEILSNGKGNITIHSKELVAGIYIYTLLVENKEIATKRMILTE